MSRVVHRVVQGSPEWHALRARHDCASDAAVMMGHSPHLSRSDFVRIKAAGGEREVSEFTQKLFDKGHEVEAFARARVEERLGIDLYPCTITNDGLLASYDGMDMEETFSLEVKLWNAELAAGVAKGEFSPLHWSQMEQQIKVGETLDHVLFVMTDGTPEKWVEAEYRKVAGRMEMVVAHWKQFHADVAAYVRVEIPQKPVAETVMALPALAVRVEGAVSLKSNVGIFAEELRSFVDRLVMKPSTDQEFANAEANVKTLEKAEEAIKAARSQARGQVASIDELERVLDACAETARASRLALSKAVDARKTQIRGEIHAEGLAAVHAHIRKLNDRMGRAFLPAPTAQNFTDAMKGKKTIATLRDAMESEVAREKVAYSEVADEIEANLKALAALPGYREALFADIEKLAFNKAEAFIAIAKERIAAHEKAEAARLEQERERIRKEEEAKAAAKPPREFPTALPIPRPALAVVQGGKKERPSDSDMLEVLSLHYGASEPEILSWLRTFDFDGQDARLKRVYAAE